MIKLIHGDCLDQLRLLPDCSVDSVVTDPPYGLSFMGKKWDYDVPGVDVWAECLRVLKPGGHLLAFAGTRTQHRMAVRIEDAGFEIRDMIAWVYGSGFPKSHDVSKAIDKAAGVAFDAVPASGVGFMNAEGAGGYNVTKNQLIRKGDSTHAARQWQGWGTALKPALEPITVARKPLVGTVAENVLAHGTGGLNVDGCRVGFVSDADRKESTAKNQHADFGTQPLTNNNVYGDYSMIQPTNYNPPGRWPANFIHDGSEEVVRLFPQTTPAKAAHRGVGKGATGCFGVYGGESTVRGHNDNGGSAARFFYCAKASKSDRDEGCDGLDEKTLQAYGDFAGTPQHGPKQNVKARNHHPTVKPTDLMRYLCRLVTPPGGTVLDPFMGSGSTGKAAVLEGFSFIGIEREAEYIAIAEARMPKTYTPDLFSHAL